MSDVNYLVDCGKRGADQVIHVDRMRHLRGQTLIGEDIPDRSLDQIVDPPVDESVEKDDNSCHDYSGNDAATDPPVRPFRSRRPPAYLKDYDTDY